MKERKEKGNVENWLTVGVMDSDGLRLNTVSSNNKKQSLDEVTSLCLSFLIFSIGMIIV